MVKKRQTEPQDDDDSTSESCDDSKSTNSKTCKHVSKSTNIANLKKILKGSLKTTCSECAKMPVERNIDVEFEYDKTLWLCLRCGTQLCGRSKNEHALKHYKTPRSDSHALALNTTTFEVWCYSCDKEVNDVFSKLSNCIDYVKTCVEESIKPEKNVNNEKSDDDDDKNIDNMKPLTSGYNLPIPGKAKRVRFSCELPTVRGLSNLGNTCFFNAVLQCLARTPFLLEVLKEALKPGEAFVLPGGKLNVKENEIELPPIKGVLANMTNSSLTAALIETLETLQSSGNVFSPDKLLNKFTTKCPQFKGFDQHDSHECLRHLLESVRCEDLNRYKKVILDELKCSNVRPESVSEEQKAKCKFYGGQAADRILRPEPVFRGFLVSTLQCQECFHTSSCHESFLDLSLPVSVEKPQPPLRRKGSPEISPTLKTIGASGPSKHQIKKEKERKAKRKAKHHNKKNCLGVVAVSSEGDCTITNPISKNDEDDDDDDNDNISDDSPTSSSSEKSDADIEDNLIDDTTKFNRKIPPLYDQNGNNELLSPISLEKRGDSPENQNKDSNDDENDSGIASSLANTIVEKEMKGGGFLRHSNNCSSVTGNNLVLELGISEEGASLIMQRSISQGSNGSAGDGSVVPPTLELSKLSLEDYDESVKKREVKRKRVRTQSHSDWCTTIAPRYQCEDGECSVQSCLNNFTAVELMTGNNKVSCDECTKRLNGENNKRIYSNATKQLLISSPPAVLILHLKRFQVGPRFMFRKLAKHVSFPMVLDIAPFCGSKIKNLPNVHRKQKKLLYALYGVVEHSGGMYGGHYTAYVKVRQAVTTDDPRWKFLPKGNKAELDQIDEQLAKLQELKEKAEAREKARQLRMSEKDSDDASSASESSTSSSSSDEVIPDESEGAVGGNDEPLEAPQEPPPGEWYYVSDSKVVKTSEESVLKVQAYLLFYERIY